ncbi:BON domain-containing protein [Candidatus Dojkabacteria bacterium]|nr:BON domain-containing protein [Candidatus Dojkabacteria bacterium]
MPTQEKVKKDVVDNLFWDTRIDASDVEVEVDDGEITLRGSVPTYTARSAAYSCVWSVQGVTKVNNQLTVKYPVALTIPDDAQIKSNIESVLLWDSDIDSTKIDITVVNNVVTLEGTVDAYWKRLGAENLADVVGVNKIVNKIAVVPSEDVSDEDIATSIVDALSRNFNVNAEKVEVKVNDGKVTLRGEVSSWIEYRSAEDTAFFTAGVKEVNNLLEIKY